MPVYSLILSIHKKNNYQNSFSKELQLRYKKLDWTESNQYISNYVKLAKIFSCLQSMSFSKCPKCQTLHLHIRIFSLNFNLESALKKVFCAKLTDTLPGLFGGMGCFLEQGTSINVSCTTYKRRALQGKMLIFFLQDTIKALHFKGKFNSWIHTNRTLFCKILGLLSCIQNRAGEGSLHHPYVCVRHWLAILL